MASSQRSIGEPCGFLPNRPGEPYFQLRLVPDRIVFRGERLSEVATTVEMQMINLTQHRQCFKIKCTSVEIFRVRPPLGFLNGGETIPIRITFFSKQVPQTGKHFFVFYHIATNEKAPPRQIWSHVTKPDGVCRVLCAFERDDGAQAVVPDAAPKGAETKPLTPTHKPSTNSNSEKRMDSSTASGRVKSSEKASPPPKN